MLAAGQRSLRPALVFCSPVVNSAPPSGHDARICLHFYETRRWCTARHIEHTAVDGLVEHTACTWGMRGVWANTFVSGNQYSPVGIVTWLRAERTWFGFPTGAKKRCFSFPNRADRLWNLPRLSIIGYRGRSGGGVRMTSLHLVSSLRMSEDIPAFPHMPPWRA